MYAAVVEPNKIAQVPGLRRKVTPIEPLDQQVEAGRPKKSLSAVARQVYGRSADAAALVQGASASNVPPAGRGLDAAGRREGGAPGAWRV